MHGKPIPSEMAVHLLQPLIGIRGRHRGRTLELIEVLADGPSVALMDIATTDIQTNQYGDALTRQPPVFTVPVFSEIEADAHPVLRSILPDSVLIALRQASAVPESSPDGEPD